MLRYFVVFVAAFIFSVSLDAQQYGCTDPKANNYNPKAAINDGSCSYRITVYNPPVRFLLPDKVNETSGLAFVNGKLLTINDSGGDPILYALDTISGEVIQEITVSGATNVDWESLANDDEYIFIGDFGNNSGLHDNLIIYRVKISDIPAKGNAVVKSSKITFSYPDYKKEEIERKKHNFDCEAFIADNGFLYLFSKNWGDAQTKLYKLPDQPGEYIAELLDTFNCEGLITGADINRINNEIILIGYINHSWIPFTWLVSDYKEDDFFSGNKRRIDMLNIAATQTEAIAFTSGRKAVMTSEGTKLFSQTAFDFDTGKWAGYSFSTAENLDATEFDFVISPNPVKKKRITVTLKSLPVGFYHIEVLDNLGNILVNKKYSVSSEGSVQKVKIRISSLVAGSYFVRMTGNGKVVEKKFMVIE